MKTWSKMMKFRWLIRQHYNPITMINEAGYDVVISNHIVDQKPVLQYQEEFHELGTERKWIDIPTTIEPPKEERND